MSPPIYLNAVNTAVEANEPIKGFFAIYRWLIGSWAVMTLFYSNERTVYRNSNIPTWPVGQFPSPCLVVRRKWQHWAAEVSLRLCENFPVENKQTNACPWKFPVSVISPNVFHLHWFFHRQCHRLVVSCNVLVCRTNVTRFFSWKKYQYLKSFTFQPVFKWTNMSLKSFSIKDVHLSSLVATKTWNYFKWCCLLHTCIRIWSNQITNYMTTPFSFNIFLILINY